jgi:hypothetical protein
MAADPFYSDEMRVWLRSLGPGDRERIGAALDLLHRDGHQLSSRLSKPIRASRHHNMRELKSVGGNLRVLFAFDPGRRPVLLLGGDKTDNWSRWYRVNVPRADRIYDEYLRRRGGEGPWRGIDRGGPTRGR